MHRGGAGAAAVLTQWASAVKLFGSKSASDSDSAAEYFKAQGWTTLTHVLCDSEDVSRDAVLQFVSGLHCEECVLFFLEERVRGSIFVSAPSLRLGLHRSARFSPRRRTAAPRRASLQKKIRKIIFFFGFRRRGGASALERGAWRRRLRAARADGPCGGGRPAAASSIFSVFFFFFSPFN